MINYLNNFSVKNFSNIKVSLFYIKNSRSLLFNIYSALTLNISYFDLEKFTTTHLLKSVEYIKIQELAFLPEYYFITILFCLTLFSLFSLKVINNDQNFSIKFRYNKQLIFLLIFGLTCYLILILQQINISILSLISFNDTIHNDQLSLIAKSVISLSSILYLIFITQYLESQKLSNFEYYIILFTSIFGFFLLCSANDLITAYLAIELQGLSFYVLASFKKSSNFSIESGVKYFILGSLSTAIFLLGTTFIYGFSGSVILTDFKDFFIWIFSANSFFLAFDSISKALEILLFSSGNNQEEIKLCNNISNKMLNFSKNIDNFSYVYYYFKEFCDYATKTLITNPYLIYYGVWFIKSLAFITKVLKTRRVDLNDLVLLFTPLLELDPKDVYNSAYGDLPTHYTIPDSNLHTTITNPIDEGVPGVDYSPVPYQEPVRLELVGLPNQAADSPLNLILNYHSHISAEHLSTRSPNEIRADAFLHEDLNYWSRVFDFPTFEQYCENLEKDIPEASIEEARNSVWPKLEAANEKFTDRYETTQTKLDDKIWQDRYLESYRLKNLKIKIAKE